MPPAAKELEFLAFGQTFHLGRLLGLINSETLAGKTVVRLVEQYIAELREEESLRRGLNPGV
jgi:hypothetical protein